ncbi:hypothetical protein B0T17DRAFT_388519 [Bombardia bombarda]|uniref:Uncharacterized protein n=1 Tax=Bombardia bombarda TaxID=252184 RepID=A0AA39T2J1_9PEZI|nr:hypothetical protein B0T17DRAFT_388519 [Bombardia bombarda]
MMTGNMIPLPALLFRRVQMRPNKTAPSQPHPWRPCTATFPPRTIPSCHPPTPLRIPVVDLAHCKPKMIDLPSPVKAPRKSSFEHYGACIILSFISCLSVWMTGCDGGILFFMQWKLLIPLKGLHCSRFHLQVCLCLLSLFSLDAWTFAVACVLRNKGGMFSRKRLDRQLGWCVAAPASSEDPCT